MCLGRPTSNVYLTAKQPLLLPFSPHSPLVFSSRLILSRPQWPDRTSTLLDGVSRKNRGCFSVYHNICRWTRPTRAGNVAPLFLHVFKMTFAVKYCKFVLHLSYQLGTTYVKTSTILYHIISDMPFLFFFFDMQNVQNCHNFSTINMSQMPLKTLEIAFPRVWFSKSP